MEKLRENLNAMIVCCFELVIGILLLIEPVKFTSGIIIVAGVVLCIVGVVYCVKYFRTDARKAAISQFLTKGLTALLVGCFFIFYSDWFINTFPVLTILYGVVILLSGLEKIQLCMDMLRFKKEKWYFAGISAVVSFVCGFIILKSPFSSMELLWTFTGVALILEGVFDLSTLIISSSYRNKMEIVEDVSEENILKEDTLEEDVFEKEVHSENYEIILPEADEQAEESEPTIDAD